MLGVAALVKQRSVVITAALVRDDHIDLLGNPWSAAERPRRLRGTGFRVQVDVFLPGDVDPEPGERALQRLDQAGRWKPVIELSSAEEPRQIRPAKAAQGRQPGAL